jgi:hypothetical protein
VEVDKFLMQRDVLCFIEPRMCSVS